MQLHSTTTTEIRTEAMGDVPGICELPLTRAVVQYRDVHEMDAAGGRIEDIGLALVVEGRYASTAEVVDLGSGSGEAPRSLCYWGWVGVSLSKRDEVPHSLPIDTQHTDFL